MTTKQKSVPVYIISSLAAAKGEFTTFPLPVKFKRLDGTEAELTFTAKVMRKSEWAALRDAQAIAPQVEVSEGDEPAKFSWTAAVETDMRKVADLVTQCATGWSVTDEFNLASLIDMEDMFGGTLGAFLSAYDAAIFHGRLGN